MIRKEIEKKIDLIGFKSSLPLVPPIENAGNSSSSPKFAELRLEKAKGYVENGQEECSAMLKHDMDSHFFQHPSRDGTI